jgi:DNA-binding NtrC family response regulator
MVDKKMKLLIVDDEKDICKFAKLLFKNEGFLTYSALSNREAIRIAKKIKPQIALLDVYLKRGRSGLDTLKQIRNIVPSCKCIMVTWDKAGGKVKEAKALGAFSYLTKPLTIDQLLKVVNRAVKGIRKRG